jgi:hypothetical protein
VLADYILSLLGRNPSFSAVLESIDFSQLRSLQICSSLQSRNFLNSFVGRSYFRSVIDCLVDLQRTAKPCHLELKERIKAEVANAASESTGKDLGRQLNDRAYELKRSQH